MMSGCNTATSFQADAKRLRTVLVLLQIVLIAWIAWTVYGAVQEWLYHFTGMTVPPAVVEALGRAGYPVCLGMLLFALYGATYRARRVSSFVGGLVILNYVLFRVASVVVALANALFTKMRGEQLIVNDPAAIFMDRLPSWAIDGWWLAIILGGFAIAIEVNSEQRHCILTNNRIRALLLIAIAAWAFWMVDRYISHIVLQPFEPILETASIGLSLTIFTLYLLATMAPAVLFSVIAVHTAHKARRTLLSDEATKPCPQCGFDLRVQNATRCPECGWAAAQSESERLR